MDRAGRSVVILRHPARAVRIADALRSCGFTPYALALTDTALPDDTSAVSRELESMRQGEHEWLVVTSGNAVRALELLARCDGTSLAEVVRVGGVRVAAVGTTTARVLLDAGLHADLVPQRESSSGLLEAFPQGAGSVLLPQADLAPDDLRAGLVRTGRTVRRIEAYRTVPYPAATPLVVPVSAEDGLQPDPLAPGDFVSLAAEGVQPAVVFMAPSAVGLFRERLGTTSRFLPVALGPTTAHALRLEGWEPAATAQAPTPGGIADAVVDAVSRPATPGPSNGDQS